MYSALAVHEGALDLWHCVCIIRCASVWTCPCVCVCVCKGGSGRRVRIYTETFQSFSWRRSCVFTPVTLKSNPIGFKDRGQCHPRAATVSLRQLPWSNIFSWHWLSPFKGHRNKRAKKTPRTSPETPLRAIFIWRKLHLFYIWTYSSGNKTSPILISDTDNFGQVFIFWQILTHLVSILLPQFY